MTVTVWPARENLQSFSALWRFEQGQAQNRRHLAPIAHSEVARVERFELPSPKIRKLNGALADLIARPTETRKITPQTR